MGKFIDLTNHRYGKLTVVREVGKNKYGQIFWQCRCDCGEQITVLGYHLRQNHTRSCGCLMKESARRMGISNRKHGCENTRLYHIWRGMKDRCVNHNNKDYKNYGGRGITICSEWNDFIKFREWAIDNNYTDDKSIDRINVNGNYCPDNCRWADDIVQHNNTRRNNYVTYQSVTHTVAEWSRILNIPYATLHRRLFKYKWDTDKAFENKLGGDSFEGNQN